MIKLGDFNELTVNEISDKVFFLKSSENERVFLPKTNCEGKDFNVGDNISAFVYKDDRDTYFATLKVPYAKANELAYLKVIELTKIGAFVDLGLSKHVLVPFKETKYELLVNKSYLFYIYIDKTGRLAATTKIGNFLETTDEYKIGSELQGTVYGFQTNNSVEVAVSNKYSGVILFNEYFTHIECGDILNLKLIGYYEDGRMNLTPRKSPGKEKMEVEEKVLEYLKSHDGFMPYNDKSSPDEIKMTFHESKNVFKHALGGLMKKRLITQDEKGTKLLVK